MRLLFLTPALLAAQTQAWCPIVHAEHGIVAAEHPQQALAGLRVLERGGNAIDAAVSVFYVTSVVEQSEAGLGGDAFLMAYIAKLKKVVVINGSGPAPKLATREAYLKLGSVPQDGPHSTAVPGSVGGFDLLLRKYGTLGYTDLLGDAIDLAGKGHIVTAWGAGNYAAAFGRISRYASTASAFYPLGRPFLPGERMVQSDLARTITAIRDGGADAFYKGPIARLTADYHEKQGGLIRYEDMAAFQAEEAEPIRTAYKGLDVLQSPPNAGGIFMLIALNIAEGFDLRKLGHNSPAYVHVITESLKLAFADRIPYIADPRVARNMPIAALLSKEYAALRRGLIRMDRAIESAPPPGDPRRMRAVLEGHSIAYTDPSRPRALPAAADAGGEQTSSFAIADRFGNVVSVTHSVNGGFGSGMVVDRAGFVLNNRAAYFGLDASDINVIAPGKRTRQGAIPAMALKDGKPFLAWNTPGGDTIPQTMLQAFLRVVEFGMTVQQACEAPTPITQNLRASYYPQKAGEGLLLPSMLYQRIGADLAKLGHPVRDTGAQEPYKGAPAGAGAMKMVRIDPATGFFEGGVSPAKDDYVLGW
ncbi:MAG: gamma-glutamyltransferase family protein [Acidobacteria bacterium]|nr:gamma-glutamyltransferase family protein [Acidobacteriota bacterium]